MMVHVVLLIYISILGLFIYAKKPYRRSSNKKFILLSLLAVFLVQSLRSRYVGTDTIKYYNYVRYAKMGLPIHSMEFLFTLLIIKIFSCIIKNDNCNYRYYRCYYIELVRTNTKQ